MTGPLVAIWNFQPRPAHVLVVLQARRRFMVRELPPRTAFHVEASLLADARVFFASTDAEARALAGNVAAGFDEGPAASDWVPGGGTAGDAGSEPGRRRRRSTWLGSKRRLR